MPPLHGTVPIEQVHHVAAAVGEDLHFHMPRSGDCLLQQHPVVTETCGRFSPGALEARLELRRAAYETHALASAATMRLDHDGITEGVRFL